jgi:hypothetical protein
MKFSKSFKIYFFLILMLAVLAATITFLPEGTYLPTIAEPELQDLKIAIALINFLIMFVLYGFLGFLGLWFSQKLGFPKIWESRISNKQRFLYPAVIGICVGVFFIILDLILSRFHSLGRLPHPPFPTSLIASIVASIGEEVIFRLFFISFWVWVISYLILKGRWQNRIFWLITIISAFLFSFSHIPTVQYIMGIGNIGEIPHALMIEIMVLNGVLSLFVAYYFRMYGFLAAVGIHLWTDIVWHVIYGFF